MPTDWAALVAQAGGTITPAGSDEPPTKDWAALAAKAGADVAPSKYGTDPIKAAAMVRAEQEADPSSDRSRAQALLDHDVQRRLSNASGFGLTPDVAKGLGQGALGLVTALRHPIDTVTGMVTNTTENAKAAYRAATRGDVPDAIARGVQAVPVAGPVVTDAIQSQTSNDPAEQEQGMGRLAFAVAAPKIINAAPAMAGDALRAAGTVAKAVPRAAMRGVAAAGDIVSPDIVGIISPRAGKVLDVAQRMRAQADAAPVPAEAVAAAEVPVEAVDTGPPMSTSQARLANHPKAPLTPREVTLALKAGVQVQELETVPRPVILKQIAAYQAAKAAGADVADAPAVSPEMATALAHPPADIVPIEAHRALLAAKQAAAEPVADVPVSPPIRAYKGGYPYDNEGNVIQEFKSPGVKMEGLHEGYVGKKGGFAGFFSDDPTVANRFAAGPKSAGYSVDIAKFERPLVIDAQGSPAANFQFGDMAKLPHEKAGLMELRDTLRGKNSGEYDGVILKNTKDEGTVYVPLKGSQVTPAFGPAKSATPNVPRSAGALALDAEPAPVITPAVKTALAELPKVGKGDLAMIAKLREQYGAEQTGRLLRTHKLFNGLKPVERTNLVRSILGDEAGLMPEVPQAAMDAAMADMSLAEQQKYLSRAPNAVAHKYIASQIKLRQR